jgi:hypothetical protein
MMRTDWGIMVGGVIDATNHYLIGKQVCKGRARMCRAQAKISSGHTLSTVDHVTGMDGGWAPVLDASTEVTVNSGFETDNDTWGIIVCREADATWDCIDFPCPV